MDEIGQGRTARLNAAYNALKTIATELDRVESQVKIATQQSAECSDRLNRDRKLLKMIKSKDPVSLEEFSGAKKLMLDIMIELHSFRDRENALLSKKRALISQRDDAILEYENASKKPEERLATIYRFSRSD